MTSVLILGAGASRPAGYPTAEELLPKIKEEASRSGSCQFRDAWDQWESFLSTLPPELELIRSCSNPEIVLSLPDLFDVTAEFEDDSRTIRASHHFRETGKSTAEELEAYFSSAGRDFLGEARVARARLVECLDWFFSFRHHDDSTRPPTERDYLRRHLSALVRGDAVITFNWDTLVERVLAEDGRWWPGDGFGFPRRLVQESGDNSGPQVATHSMLPSELVVLKLHGSYGWRSLGERFFLDGLAYLSEFAFPHMDASKPVRDSDEPFQDSQGDLVVVYPSFFKHVAGPVLARIWALASAYLSRATFVEIIGYSLPASDSAARALLLPLTLRLDSGAARVVVQDQSARTLGRWREFLGPRAEFRQEALHQ
jgi:hypothetical protein